MAKHGERAKRALATGTEKAYMGIGERNLVYALGKVLARRPHFRQSWAKVEDQLSGLAFVGRHQGNAGQIVQRRC